MSSNQPIFIAGPDRSGTTLLYALLASHPNISMVRRTNFWRWFYDRYGDLSNKDNFDRLLDKMLRYKRIQPLHPDGERIRREFWQGEPSYGRVFSLFQQHHAERVGKPRWGDKSLHTEHYIEQVLSEFPNAKFIHMSRDPRDRYASVRKRFGKDTPRLGAATARWLLSMRAAERNKQNYPANYKIIRFEDLAGNPQGTSQIICDFIGEEYSAEMLTMRGASKYRNSGGNSSFEEIKPGAISTKPIGRYKNVLTTSEIAFIQLFARKEMRLLGYQKETTIFSFSEAIKFIFWILPFQMVRMLGWSVLTSLTFIRKARVPESRFINDADERLSQLGA
ncbi:MAG: sulfotransferase [Anaerolineales bacterium]